MITLSISSTLALIALAYSLLLAFKLLTLSGGDTIANALLAMVCFSMSAWIATSIARDVGLYVSHPHLLYIVTPMFYLLGPALLAYTRRLTVGAHPFGHGLSWMHLLPFALFIVAAIPFYSSSADEKLAVFRGTRSPNLVMGVLFAIMVPHMLTYTLLCLRPIRRYEAAAKDHVSDLEYGNLRWLKRLCIGMLALILIDAILSRLLAMTPWVVDSISPSFVMRISLAFYVVFVAFSALGQPAFMYRETSPSNGVLPRNAPPSIESAQAMKKGPQEKYARSGLRDDSARYYVSKLENLMREQKAYLDCDLTLRSLAAMIKLRPHLLSQILNEQVGKSFYDYINEHRVAYAKQLLAAGDGAAKSILDVAFESGYKNKVSFNGAFRRFVGMTPTEYRSEHSKSATIVSSKAIRIEARGAGETRI